MEVLKVEGPGAGRRRGRVRRAGVSAESVDPAEEAKGYKKVVIPKSDQSRARIEEAVKQSILFSGLDEDQRKEIFGAMREVKAKKDEVIIQEGTNGDFFYVVESGVYDVYKGSGEERKKVFSYNNTGSFGELALMYNCPRAATVQAATEGVLWAIDRTTFRVVIVFRAAERRKLHEKFLEKVEILGNLSKEERSRVADCLQSLSYEDGDYVITQGEVGDTFYIIEQGVAIATQKDQKGELVEVGRMEVGQYFGERALLTNEPRAANVVSKGSLKVVAMDRAAFERLLGDCTDVMKRQIVSYIKAR